MSDVKKHYPDVRALVGNSIYVKASVVTASGKEHMRSVFSNEVKVQILAMQHQAERLCCSNPIFLVVFVRTGSDLVDAEKTGIKIVLSPYVVSFKDTMKYFKPGLPFDFTVSTAGVLSFLFWANPTTLLFRLLCRSK